MRRMNKPSKIRPEGLFRVTRRRTRVLRGRGLLVLMFKGLLRIFLSIEALLLFWFMRSALFYRPFLLLLNLPYR